MGFVHLTKHFDRPPEAVFEYVVRTDGLPRWLTPITRISNAADRLDAVGSKFDADLKLGGRMLETTWEVVTARPPRSLVLNGTAADGAQATLWARLDLWDAGTEMEYEIDYELPGGFVANLADKLFVERSIARDLKHSLETLREIVEHDER